MLGVQIFFTGFIFFVVGLFIVKIHKKVPSAYVAAPVLAAVFGGLAAMVVGFLMFIWSWRL